MRERIKEGCHVVGLIGFAGQGENLAQWNGAVNDINLAAIELGEREQDIFGALFQGLDILVESADRHIADGFHRTRLIEDEVDYKRGLILLGHDGPPFLPYKDTHAIAHVSIPWSVESRRN